MSGACCACDTSHSKKMIIIADSHVGLENDLNADFLNMLKALENSAEDVVFLGDIFDLWIGYNRYEESIHREFLTWCQTQKERRKIYFTEGNHEFFINAKRRGFFSVYDDSRMGFKDGEILFMHGDRVNLKDKNYLRFRGLVKSRFVAFLVRFVPCAPKIVHYVKNSLKKTKKNFRKFIPQAEIMEFAALAKTYGIKFIFMGHFHHAEVLEADGVIVCMVPDWYKTRQVVRFDPESGKMDFLPWQEAVAL